MYDIVDYMQILDSDNPSIFLKYNKNILIEKRKLYVLYEMIKEKGAVRHSLGTLIGDRTSG